MTREEKLQWLETWQTEIQQSRAKFKPLSDLLKLSHESGPEIAFYGMHDAYTKAVAELVGDEVEWLFWHWLENDFGAKGMPAGPVGKTKPIKTLEGLLWLIEVTA